MTAKYTKMPLVWELAFLAALALSTAAMQDVAFAGDTSFVYRAYMETTELIPGSAAAAEASGLPASLVIPPGRYAFAGKTYDLQKQGLYRFCRPFKENQQRIVYDVHGGDVEALLSGLAWIASHGYSDQSKSNEALTQKATTAKIFIICAGVSRWAVDVLTHNKVRARRVGSFTLAPSNGYDDGHSLIEVYREDCKKWVLYDLDNNACFLRKETPLSLVEMVDCVQSGEDYEIKLLSSDTPLDVSNFKSPKNGYDWAFNEEFSNSKNGLRRWYKRVLQVPLIDDCYCLPAPNGGDRPCPKASPQKKPSCMTRSEFLKKYY